jgi:hypothetical protein
MPSDEIVDTLVDFFTPEQAMLWLNLPHPRLAGRTPLVALATGGRNEVTQAINRLRG